MVSPLSDSFYYLAMIFLRHHHAVCFCSLAGIGKIHNCKFWWASRFTKNTMLCCLTKEIINHATSLFSARRLGIRALSQVPVIILDIILEKTHGRIIQKCLGDFYSNRIRLPCSRSHPSESDYHTVSYLIIHRIS